MNERQDDGMVTVGEIKAGGTTWEVFFNTGTHQFRATSPGLGAVSGRDWGGLEGQAQACAATSRVKVSVPYVAVAWVAGDGGEVPTLVPGIATGIHGGSGKVLAVQDGRARSLDIVSWGGDGYMTPFAEGEADRYLGLLARRRALDEMIRGCEEAHRWNGGNLRREVERQVEEARVAAMAETQDEEPGHGYWDKGDL